MMQISLVCYIRNINIHYCGGLLLNNSFCFEGKNNQERSCNYIVLGSARSGSELVWEIRVTPRTHTLCSRINIRMPVWSILIEISILVFNKLYKVQDEQYVSDTSMQSLLYIFIYLLISRTNLFLGELSSNRQIFWYLLFVISTD